MSTRTTFYCVIFVFFLTSVFSQSTVNLLIVIESTDKFILGLLNEVVSFAQQSVHDTNFDLYVEHVVLDRENSEGNYEAVKNNGLECIKKMRRRSDAALNYEPFQYELILNGIE